MELRIKFRISIWNYSISQKQCQSLYRIYKKSFTIWYHENHYYGKKKRELPKMELRNQLTPTDVKLQTVISVNSLTLYKWHNKYWRVNKKCCENVFKTRDDRISIFAIVIKTVVFFIIIKRYLGKNFHISNTIFIFIL